MPQPCPCLEDETCRFCAPITRRYSDDLLELYNNPAEAASKSFSSPPSSHNNGGSTDYYKLDPSWTDCSDIIEARQMSYNQGNILKAAFTFNLGRHEGTTYERELNKII